MVDGALDDLPAPPSSSGHAAPRSIAPFPGSVSATPDAVLRARGLHGWIRCKCRARAETRARLQPSRELGRLDGRQCKLRSGGRARSRHGSANGRRATQPGGPGRDVAHLRAAARRRDRVLARGRIRLGTHPARDPVGGYPRDPHGSKHRCERRLVVRLAGGLGFRRRRTARRTLVDREHTRRARRDCDPRAARFERFGARQRSQAWIRRGHRRR